MKNLQNDGDKSSRSIVVVEGSNILLQLKMQGMLDLVAIVQDIQHYNAKLIHADLQDNSTKIEELLEDWSKTTL